MKVFDIVSEGIFGKGAGKLLAQEVVDTIAKGWAKEIKLYKREFGEIPAFKDLTDIVPAESLTVEKAIARDPANQQAAYREALRLHKEFEKAQTKQLSAAARQRIIKKIDKGGVTFSNFLRAVSSVALAFEVTAAYRTYNQQLDDALVKLDLGPERGGYSPEDFKLVHDRILIQFYAQAVASIVLGGLSAKTFYDKIRAAAPAEKFLSNLITSAHTAAYAGILAFLDSDTGQKELLFYLTAEGMELPDGTYSEPGIIGGAIEKWIINGAAKEHFKAEVLAAAQKKGKGDKIPPSMRPAPAAQPAQPAPAQQSAGNEPAAPVSGGLPSRPQQSGQAAPVGTSSEWK
jgi:hypothetical protein